MAYIRSIAGDPGFTIDEMLPPELLRRQELLCSQLQGAHRLRWGTRPPSQRSNPGQKRIVRRDSLENSHVRGLVEDSQDYFREQKEELLEVAGSSMVQVASPCVWRNFSLNLRPWSMEQSGCQGSQAWRPGQ